MMAEIHERMPVILDPEYWDRWMMTEPNSANQLEGPTCSRDGRNDLQDGGEYAGE